MSRSFRKTPICGTVNSSGHKKFKQDEHRAERNKVKQLLRCNKELMPNPKEYGNEWASPRDGKFYFGDCSYYEKYMRK